MDTRNGQTMSQKEQTQSSYTEQMSPELRRWVDGDLSDMSQEAHERIRKSLRRQDLQKHLRERLK